LTIRTATCQEQSQILQQTGLQVCNGLAAGVSEAALALLLLHAAICSTRLCAAGCAHGTQHGTDPTTCEPVSILDLHPNLLLREMIEKWLAGTDPLADPET
jgi:hypothetical protein